MLPQDRDHHVSAAGISSMNLRRIMEHVRKLEWPAIGIELVIVIVGVFIGMQVSNWNVEREARQRGAMFAERLKADLREEAWYYQLQIEYSRDVLDNVAREGMQSRYREAFRMTLPNDVQRALGSNCGDRFVRAGDYEGLGELIDYPCRTGLSAGEIEDAVKLLRANDGLVPLLRLRIADLETRLVDLTGNNKDVMQGLQAIANE